MQDDELPERHLEEPRRPILRVVEVGHEGEDFALVQGRGLSAIGVRSELIRLGRLGDVDLFIADVWLVLTERGDGKLQRRGRYVAGPGGKLGGVLEAESVRLGGLAHGEGEITDGEFWEAGWETCERSGVDSCCYGADVYSTSGKTVSSSIVEDGNIDLR